MLLRLAGAILGRDLRRERRRLDDQAMALPCASVMVIIVLLKLELTCATPVEMFLRSRRRTRPASLAICGPSVRYRRRRNASGYTKGVSSEVVSSE
jgi:hypothetical protein